MSLLYYQGRESFCSLIFSSPGAVNCAKWFEIMDFFFSWTTICSGTIQVNKVIQFMFWLPLSLLYLQCIFCYCYNIDQGVYCKCSIEWWCALCVEKVRWCQSTSILHTQRSAWYFYFDQITLLIHLAHSAKKTQQSLQPDKHHKLNKTGAVAHWSQWACQCWKHCTLKVIMYIVSEDYKRNSFPNKS